IWPFQSQNWGTIKNYLLYRTLPEPLRVDGREMQVWVRKDLAASGSVQPGESSGGAVKLVAQDAIGGPGAEAGRLDQPRGITVDDIGNGRRALTTDGSAAGNAAATLGFYGPRAVAVDERGSVYIADTGNKRIVVTDGDGVFLYQWGHGGNEPGAFNEPIGLAV